MRSLGEGKIKREIDGTGDDSDFNVTFGDPQNPQPPQNLQNPTTIANQQLTNNQQQHLPCLYDFPAK